MKKSVTSFIAVMLIIIFLGVTAVTGVYIPGGWTMPFRNAETTQSDSADTQTDAASDTQSDAAASDSTDTSAGLDSLLRVGDLRDLDRYTVVAGQGDGRLGEALVGQTLTDDLLNRVHVVREVGLIIAVRDLRLVNDTGAAYQVKTQTDAVVGVEDARDDRLFSYE